MDIPPWHDQTTDELWRLCGFDEKPPYMPRVAAPARAGDHLPGPFLTRSPPSSSAPQARQARQAHVHIDCTEDETHAALVHDCRRNEPCPYREKRKEQRRARFARRPARVPTAVARADRQKENAEAPEGLDPKRAVFEIVERGGRMIKRIWRDGCWYRTLDTEAGIRAYTGKRGAQRFWHGYYNQKAIDHFTGGVLFAGIYNACVQEYYLFPDLFETLTHILGHPPESIIADKGQSIDQVFEICTTNGTAAIIPWRPWGSEKDRTDYETHDRHGIPRCKHCGGPMEQTRFSAKDESRACGSAA